MQEAVEAAEARATRELRAALRRQRQEKDEERHRALEKQKWYAERLAARVCQQRDRAEAERMKELKKQLEEEKQEALRLQWEECERLKEEAVEEACTALRKRLRDEFAVEREKAIAEALRIARVRCRISTRSSWCAVSVCIEEHIPQRLSVLTIPNQVDPFASTRPSSMPIPDLFSLSISLALFPLIFRVVRMYSTLCLRMA